jgi:hypothetical protein
MLLSLSISLYQYLSPPGHRVHFSIEVFWWHVAAEVLTSGINWMLRVGWLPQQPSQAIDDIWTPVFDKALVIVMLSHILECV